MYMATEKNEAFLVDPAQAQQLRAMAEAEGVQLETLLDRLMRTYGEQQRQLTQARELRTILEESWATSKENGTDNMTMDEINAEIAETRAERRLRRPA